jgi:hypothetical protein
MPVLVSNQTSNTNNEEQIYEQEESSPINGATTQNEPVVNLFKILDEPSETNGGNELNTHNNLFELLNTGTQQTNQVGNLFFDDDLPKSPSSNGINTSIPPMTVVDKNGLRIHFQFEKQDKILVIHLQATNSTQIPITNFVFKAAVPKVIRLK